MTEIHLYENKPEYIPCPVCGESTKVEKNLVFVNDHREIPYKLEGLCHDLTNCHLETEITCYHCGTVFHGVTIGGTYLKRKNTFIIHPEGKQ